MAHIQVAGVFDVFTKRKSFPKEKSTGMIWMSGTVTEHCKPWRVWGCHRVSLDSKNWMCCSNSVAAANLLLVNCLDSWICAQYDRENYKQWIHTHTPRTIAMAVWEIETRLYFSFSIQTQWSISSSYATSFRIICYDQIMKFIILSRCLQVLALLF